MTGIEHGGRPTGPEKRLPNNSLGSGIPANSGPPQDIRPDRGRIGEGVTPSRDLFPSHKPRIGSLSIPTTSIPVSSANLSGDDARGIDSTRRDKPGKVVKPSPTLFPKGPVRLTHLEPRPMGLGDPLPTAPADETQSAEPLLPLHAVVVSSPNTVFTVSKSGEVTSDTRQTEQKRDESLTVHTKTQQDILDAKTALERWTDFNKKPTEPVFIKGRRAKGIEIRRRNEAQEGLVRELTTGLFNDPDKLATTMEVWHAQNEAGSGLYQKARVAVMKEMQTKWAEVPAEDLARYVQLNTKDPEGETISGSVLKAYFRGPSSVKERADALYTFTLGALTLTTDEAALNLASRIGKFDTKILERGGSYHVDTVIASVYSFEDPETKKRANITTQVLHSLTFLSSEQEDEIKERNMEAMQDMFRDPRYIASFRQAQVRSERIKGREFIRDRIEARNELAEQGISINDIYTYAEEGLLSEQDIEDLVSLVDYDLADPLFIKFREEAGPKVLPALQRGKFEKDFPDQQFVHVTKRIPGKNYVMEVSIPTELIGRKEDVIADIRIGAHPEEEFDSPDDGLPKSYISTGNFEGKPVQAIYREPVTSELSRHDLEFIAEYGFPSVDNPDLAEENNRLANAIAETQTRFLNRRGVQVPTTHPILKELGYKKFEFRKDPNDPEQTNVTIHVKDGQIKFKLDRYMGIDFEGKGCEGTSHEDVRHVTLTYLQKILCEPSIKDESGEVIDMSHLFFGRAGHMAYLPVGQNFSHDQEKAFFEEEGRDLATHSERRRPIDPEGKNRKSTYRKPTDKEGEHIEPRYISIPLEPDFFHRTAQHV